MFSAGFRGGGSGAGQGVAVGSSGDNLAGWMVEVFSDKYTCYMCDVNPIQPFFPALPPVFAHGNARLVHPAPAFASYPAYMSDAFPIQWQHPHPLLYSAGLAPHPANHSNPVPLRKPFPNSGIPDPASAKSGMPVSMLGRIGILLLPEELVLFLHAEMAQIEHKHVQWHQHVPNAQHLLRLVEAPDRFDVLATPAVCGLGIHVLLLQSVLLDWMRPKGASSSLSVCTHVLMCLPKDLLTQITVLLCNLGIVNNSGNVSPVDCTEMAFRLASRAEHLASSTATNMPVLVHLLMHEDVLPRLRSEATKFADHFLFDNHSSAHDSQVESAIAAGKTNIKE
ncbi:hypothetical protein JCM3770_005185, partial [Rhodotorula araucariae]